MAEGCGLVFAGRLLAVVPLAAKPERPLDLRQGDRRLGMPEHWVLLAAGDDRPRLVFLVRVADAGAPTTIFEGTTPRATVTPLAADDATEVAARISALPAAAAGRLMGWLLEVGRVSRLSRHAGYAAFCLAVATAVSERRVGTPYTMGQDLQCLLTPGPRRQEMGASWCLAAGTYRRSRFPAAAAPSVLMQLVDLQGEAGHPDPFDLTAVVVERPGNRPLLLERHGEAREPYGSFDAVPFDSRVGLASYLWRSLAPLHRRPGVATLLRGLAALRETPPTVVTLASPAVAGLLACVIPTDDGQIFLRGTLIDPEAAVERLTLELPYQPPVSLSTLARFDDRLGAAAVERTADWSRAGFMTRLADQPPVGIGGVTAQVTLHMPGGRQAVCVAPRTPASPFEARTALFAGLSPADLPEGAMTDILAPVARRLQQQVLAHPRVADLVSFGTPAQAPRRSLIIPLYRTLDFLRFQLGAFAIDPDMADSEIVYVLDSPEDRGAVERELRERCRVLGLAARLVVMTRNFGYAPAVNAGAQVAAGRTLVLLNSDVVPAGPGWLRHLDAVADAEPDVGAVGPRLLFHDGSLQHAGLYFDRSLDDAWMNRHYWKGFPGDYPPATTVRAVPGVTGACIRIDRTLYEQIGGLCEDYIIGDYEDSDLCLKLIAAGRRNIYAGNTSLYHYERCSMSRHEGYERTLVGTYNRWLHIQRWDDLMTQVMTAFDGSSLRQERAA